jgi:hypothetical protein
MKKTILTFAVMAVYGPMAVLACSSSSSSGGGGSVSSIDPAKQAGSLSDSEKTQYCKDANAYLASQINETDSKKAACFSQAFSSIYLGGTPPKDDAELQSKCKTAYDECLSKPLDKGDAGSTSDDCATATKEYANCTATVGEINTCLQDTATQLKTLYATFDSACSKAQLDGGGLPTQGNTDQPASCKAVSAKCPGVGGGD